MAYQQMSLIDVKEILRLWLAARLLREVTTLAGVDRKTVRRYVQAAAAAGLVGSPCPRPSSADTTDPSPGPSGLRIATDLLPHNYRGPSVISFWLLRNQQNSIAAHRALLHQDSAMTAVVACELP
jgi:hypothetical protein